MRAVRVCPKCSQATSIFPGELRFHCESCGQWLVIRTYEGKLELKDLGEKYHASRPRRRHTKRFEMLQEARKTLDAVNRARDIRLREREFKVRLRRWRRREKLPAYMKELFPELPEERFEEESP